MAEIARTVAFLLSDGAGYITGQNIRVDRGLTRLVCGGSRSIRTWPYCKALEEHFRKVQGSDAYDHRFGPVRDFLNEPIEASSFD